MQQSDLVHSPCAAAFSLKKNIERNFLLLGQALCLAKRSRAYEAEWQTWDVFLEELAFEESKASKLIGIWETFVERHQLPPETIVEAGGWTKVYDVLPMAKGSREAAESWLEKARLLTRADLKQEVQLARKGIAATAACACADCYRLEICRDCGSRRRIG